MPENPVSSAMFNQLDVTVVCTLIFVTKCLHFNFVFGKKVGT